MNIIFLYRRRKLDFGSELLGAFGLKKFITFKLINLFYIFKAISFEYDFYKICSKICQELIVGPGNGFVKNEFKSQYI